MLNKINLNDLKATLMLLREHPDSELCYPIMVNTSDGMKKYAFSINYDEYQMTISRPGMNDLHVYMDSINAYLEESFFTPDSPHYVGRAFELKDDQMYFSHDLTSLDGGQWEFGSSAKHMVVSDIAKVLLSEGKIKVSELQKYPLLCKEKHDFQDVINKLGSPNSFTKVEMALILQSASEYLSDAENRDDMINNTGISAVSLHDLRERISEDRWRSERCVELDVDENEAAPAM